MNKIYSYVDNSRSYPITLMETSCESITVADKLFEEHEGIKAIKSPHIGCRVLNDWTFKPPTDKEIERLTRWQILVIGINL